MNEALFSQIRFGIKIMEGLACITGFLCWARLYPRFWRGFPFYLLIITCCEFAGWYMNGHSIFKPARLMYNYFVIPLEFLFMHYLYYHSLSKEFRKTVVSLSVIFILTFVVEYVLLINVKWIWMSLTYATGCITILILSVIYFLGLIRNEKVVMYIKEPFFWVNLGLILFYVGAFPYYVTINYLYKINVPLFYTLSWLSLGFNYLMYLFFIVAFLCFRKPQKY
jgi:hypothetical protein